jgi:hypothetical protein
VSYRRSPPDNATVQEAMEKLREYDIDPNTLVPFSTEHCWGQNSQQKENVPIRDNGVENVRLPSVILKFLNN